MPDQNEVELPPFVIDGAHEDAEWREAASTHPDKRNRQQTELAAKAPARHPYGPQAVLDERSDGQKRWFPSAGSDGTLTSTQMRRISRSAPSRRQ